MTSANLVIYNPKTNKTFCGVFRDKSDQKGIEELLLNVRKATKSDEWILKEII